MIRFFSLPEVAAKLFLKVADKTVKQRVTNVEQGHSVIAERGKVFEAVFVLTMNKVDNGIGDSVL